MIPAWLWLSLVTLVLFGLTGITQKVSTNHISTPLSFLGFAAAFVPIAAVLIWFGVDLHPAASIVALGILGGALNGFGALTSFAAFETGGKASIVMPLISLYPLVTVVCAKVFLHEDVSSTQLIGVLLTPLAAVLLSLEAPNDR